MLTMFVLVTSCSTSQKSATLEQRAAAGEPGPVCSLVAADMRACIDPAHAQQGGISPVGSCIEYGLTNKNQQYMLDADVGDEPARKEAFGKLFSLAYAMKAGLMVGVPADRLRPALSELEAACVSLRD